MERPNIVVLGAGYGGLMTTKKLQKILGHHEATITLVNKYDYHYQTTWLHESAAGTLHHDRTRVAIKDVINMNKVKFIQDTVISIQPDDNEVKLENSVLHYDILVIGLGFELETYGIPGLREHAFIINDLNSARLIREHIEYNFALFNNEATENEARLNLVVGGAGYTGIEFLGELANRVPELCKEYDVKKVQVRIIALEDKKTIIPGCESHFVNYAMNSLESRGVEILTDATIKECKSESIIYEKDGVQVELPTMTTIWAAGMKANSIVEESGFQTKDGKVNVRKDLRAPGYDNVFVVGDCALIKHSKTMEAYPSTAQIAVQTADRTAHNIKSLVLKKELDSFEPKTHGTVASLGSNDAMGSIFNDRNIFGWKATAMKKIIDNQYLYRLGGFSLLINKGKFNFFY